MVNRIVLVGRLVADPELRYTASGIAVATFRIAVDRPFKNQQGEKQTDFINIKTWRQRAEFVANYVTKGRLVAVDGRLEIRDYVGKDGQKRWMTEVVADQVNLLDRPKEGGAAPSATTPPSEAEPTQDFDDTDPFANA